MQRTKRRRFVLVGLFIGIALLVVMSAGMMAHAVPASPFPLEARQADGAVVTIFKRGDEFFNWNEDERGYVIAFDQASGNWTYAFVNADSEIAPGREIVGKGVGAGMFGPGFRMTRNNLAPLFENVDRGEPEPVISKGTPYNHTQNSQAILLLLIEYNDQQFATTYGGGDVAAHWSNQYFGATGNTVNTYYKEVSGGFNLQYVKPAFKTGVTAEAGYTVPGPLPAGVTSAVLKNGVARVKLNSNHLYYTGRTEEQDISLAFNAVKDCIDFSVYANTGGYILCDEFTIASVIAGYEESGADTEPLVWAHALMRKATHGGKLRSRSVTYPGLVLQTYATQGELDDDGLPMAIGVTAHELGHVLGLPDLYSYFDGKNRVGEYSLMDGGSWGIKNGSEPGGTTPTHLDAWSKIQLGFAAPTTISATDYWKNNVRSFNDVGGYNVLKITSAADPKQYFLVENRQLTGYDAGLWWASFDSADGGILVWHIDEAAIDASEAVNGGNDNDYHLGVELEKYNGGYPLTPYPYYVSGGAFNNTTSPNSKFHTTGHSTHPATFTDCHPQTLASSVELKVNSPKGSAMQVEAGVEPAPTYGVTLDKSGTVTFPAAIVGYGAQAAQTVTVTNTGNQATGALTIALSGTNQGDFTLSKVGITDIAVGGNDSFTVVPKGSLAVGPYTATVTVSGANSITASFDVSFTVNPALTYSISLDKSGTVTFPAAIFGYGAQTAQTVTVNNTGNQATGALTIALSGTNQGDFTLSKVGITDIAVGGNDSFTVVPKGSLAVGPYTATVTVSGANSITASFDVNFTVNPVPVYSIGLDKSGTVTFPAATVGYGAQTAQTVTVSNTGNQATGALTIALSGTNQGDFTLSKVGITDIAVGGNDSFTVVPKGSLAVGPYTATVTVSGANSITASFDVSFTVNPVLTYSIALDQSGTVTFPAATVGYGAQTAQTVTVSNTGNQATGALTIALSGTNQGDFTLSKAGITDIAVGGDDTFTVVPKTSLAVGGPYTATVTVSGANSITASFDVSFTVNPVPVYAVTLSEASAYTFPAATVGYGAQTARSVTVNNTGNQATGALTIALSGTNQGDFTLSKVGITDIAVGGNDSFTVVPKGSLAVGPYTATVTVSGGNGITASFDVNFTVNPPTPTYGVTLDKSGTVTFPAAIVGYGAQAAQSVTVTNTGNQATGALTIALSGTNQGDFTLSKVGITDIAVGGDDTFTVVPKTSLAIGPYTATVTVSGGNGITASFNVSFTVNPVPVYSIALDKSGTVTFPAATVGYGAQTAQTVTVSNTGNQATGALTIALSGTNQGDFTLSKAGITDIAVGGNDSFTVVPKGSLAVGPYTATVTVSGGNGITASFDVSFTVNPVLTYSVALDKSGTVAFPVAMFGYGAQAAQTVTVSNTGNQATGALTIALSGTNQGDFTLSKVGITDIAVGGDDTFTVVPNAGLAAGPYTATVTVSGGNGITASFNVSFTVSKAAGAPVSAGEVPVVSGTPTANSITVLPVTLDGATGQSVEYSISPVSGAAAAGSALQAGGWQSGTTFTGLTSNTAYYVYARSAANANYEAGSAVCSAPITTAASDATVVLAIPSLTGATIGDTTITANVGNGVASMTINATVSPGATYELFSDAACTDKIADNVMNFAVGVNTAYLKVTAEDGVTFKVYTLTVTRASEPIFPSGRVKLVRTKQHDVFKNAIKAYGSNGLYFESTGKIAVDSRGFITYRFCGIGKATVTAFDALTGEEVGSVEVCVQWTWHWILVILAFGWLYL